MMTFSIMAMAMLQIADAYTTHLVLSRGGYEANPVMAWVLDKLGFGGFVLLKVCILAWIIYELLAGTMPLWLVWSLNGLYAVVVAWNVRQHRLSRSRV